MTLLTLQAPDILVLMICCGAPRMGTISGCRWLYCGSHGMMH